MKAELEAEYLATFKKTVAMHEMFLQRLASHKIFRNDANFKVFLTYKDDLSVRGRNKVSFLQQKFYFSASHLPKWRRPYMTIISVIMVIFAERNVP